MKTFPKPIEQWRTSVMSQLARLFIEKPAWKSLTDALRLTIDTLPDVILAIIRQESSGNPTAVGDGGDSIGLMQLNYKAGAPQDVGYEGSAEGLFDPNLNIYYGTKIFLKQLEKYRDLDSAIAAYNAGHASRTQAGSFINQDYVSSVISFLSEKKTSSSSGSPVSPGTSLADSRVDALDGDSPETQREQSVTAPAERLVTIAIVGVIWAAGAIMFLTHFFGCW